MAAQAHQTLGDIENALLARMQLTQVLSDDEEVAQNHQQIWHILDKQTDIQLASLINTGNGSTYQGWLALTHKPYATPVGNAANLKIQCLPGRGSFHCTRPQNNSPHG